MSFMLAAKYYGVDTHPMDGFDASRVRADFGIPDRYIIAMLIAVGYRDATKTLLPRLGRQELSEACVDESFLAYTRS
jgi:nitroreductase